VAVEKVGFSEKNQKSGDSKCLEDWGKSFVELPDAKQFLQIRRERVFQQPQDFSTPIQDGQQTRPHNTFGIPTSARPLRRKRSPPSIFFVV
jgi:hypothetical protein